MKKFTLSFLAVLILVKLLLGSILIYNVKDNPLGLEGQAIASELPEETEGLEGKAGTVSKEKDIDLEFILQRQTDLRKKEEGLAKTKAELLDIQAEINRKIEILTRLRNEIRAQMNQKKTMEDAKLRHLIRAYSAMKPQKAATLIEKLDINFAIELLSKMKGDTVGSILTFVEVGKAAKISEGLAQR